MQAPTLGKLTVAVDVLERHVLDPIGEEWRKGRDVHAALCDVVSHALQTGSLSSEGVSPVQGYAMQILLSLSRRSDEKFKAYFSAMSEIGLAPDEQHARLKAASDLDILGIVLLVLQDPSSISQIAAARGDCPLRVQVKESTWWPKIFRMLFDLAEKNPILRIEFSLVAEADSGKSSFVEFFPSGNLLCPLKSVNIHIGCSNLDDPAFLASLWTISRIHFVPSQHTSDSIVSLHLLASILRCVFSLKAPPIFAVLPHLLLGNNLSSIESSRHFCRSAQQLISTLLPQSSDSNISRFIPADPVFLVPLNSCNEQSFAQRMKQIWLADAQAKLNSHTCIDLQAHLLTCGWHLQRLAAYHMSLLILYQPMEEISEEKSQQALKKCRMSSRQHFSEDDGDHLSRQMVLQFAWTGAQSSNELTDLLSMLAKSLADAVKLFNINNLEPLVGNPFQEILADYWNFFVRVSWHPAVATQHLIASVRLCIATLEALTRSELDKFAGTEDQDISQINAKQSSFRQLLDATIDACRIGISQTMSNTSTNLEWTKSASAAGMAGMLLLVSESEALQGPRASECSLNFGRLKSLLKLTCQQEGAPMCDLVKTLCPAEAAALNYRLGL